MTYRIRRITTTFGMLALFAMVLMGAKPTGCGGNLTDNCLQDRDCQGGQFCSNGVCRQFVQPKPDAGERDRPPQPDVPGNDTSAGCKAGTCPSGQYCAASGKCETLPTTQLQCDYKVDTNGMLSAAGQTFAAKEMKLGTNTLSDTGVAVSPDGRFAATITETSHLDRIKLWDLTKGKLVRSFAGEKIVWHQRMLPFLQFSPDGKRLYANYCSAMKTVIQAIHCSEMRGWDLSSGAALGLTKKYNGKIYRIATSANGMYTVTVQEDASSSDPALMIWKQGSNKPLKSYPLGTFERPSTRSTSKPLLCNTSGDCAKNEFCKEHGRNYRTCYVKKRELPHRSLVTALVVTDTGVVFSGDLEGAVTRWDQTQSKVVLSVPKELNVERAILSMSLRADQGQLLVGARELRNDRGTRMTGNLFWFDVATGKKAKDASIGDSLFPTKVAFWADNRVRFSVNADSLYRGIRSGWGVWHGVQGRDSRIETIYRSADDIAKGLGWSALLASSADDKVRIALSLRNEIVHFHVWRCVNPCQGVRCGAGSFCRYGRCVGAQKECKGAEVRACYTGPKDKLDIGECKSGSEICLEGYWRGRCWKERLPQSELCNQKDDDCDGSVDNKCVKPCREDKECDPVFKGQVCRAGRCVAKSCKSTGECGRGQICEQGTCTKCVPTKELCDGKDNDCDGAIDNGCSCSGAETFRLCPPLLGSRCHNQNAPRYQLCGRKYSNSPLQWTSCKCQPSYNDRVCENDSQCAPNKDQVCINRQCVSKSCKSNADCPDSKSCVRGLCANPECKESSECSSRYNKDPGFTFEYVCALNRCFGGDYSTNP